MKMVPTSHCPWRSLPVPYLCANPHMLYTMRNEMTHAHHDRRRFPGEQGNPA
jgi:hypothetical protein